MVTAPGTCILTLMEYIVSKRKHVVMVAVAALVLSLGASANAYGSDQKQDTQQRTSQQQQTGDQDKSTDRKTNDKSQQQGTQKLVGETGQGYLVPAQIPSQVLATSLIGMTIRNKAEQIGTIKDLIMNKDYKVVGFVVDMSGMTGLVGKSVGISRRAVTQVDPKKGVVVVKIKKSQLQDVREYSSQAEMQQAKEEQ